MKSEDEDTRGTELGITQNNYERNQRSHRRGNSSIDAKTHRQLPNLEIAPYNIVLGTTRLKDYTKIQVLGKGTYGEVHKCIHNASG